MLLLQYIFGCVIASLLGFLLLLRNWKNKPGKARIHAVLTLTNARSLCSADVIVVGAGVAISALTDTLEKVGHRVHVIERDLTKPHRIVRELLQLGGYLKLVELCLEDCVEEIEAQQIYGYTLFKDGHNTKLPYPLEKYGSHVTGRSFHNGRFVQRMQEKAASLPDVHMEEGTITSLFARKSLKE